MSKKNKLSDRLEKMVRHNTVPNSLEDFLSEQPKNNHEILVTDSNKLLLNNTNYKRAEFRFPKHLSEQLRQLSYKLNMKKTDIVQEALLDYFSKIEQQKI
jgi:hypothetical protein